MLTEARFDVMLTQRKRTAQIVSASVRDANSVAFRKREAQAKGTLHGDFRERNRRVRRLEELFG